MANTSQSDKSPTTPSGPSPWSERQVNAVYLAACIIVALAGIVVMAGSIWAANMMLGMLPIVWKLDVDEAFRPVPAAGLLTLMFWGTVLVAGARMQPKDAEISDYGEIRIVSSAIRLLAVGIVLLAGLACVSLAKNAGVHPSVALLGVLAMMLGFPVINMIIGPQVQRRSPGTWAQALARSEDVIKASAERTRKPLPIRRRILFLFGLVIAIVGLVGNLVFGT